jgi:single-strand DNA-binding protein
MVNKAILVGNVGADPIVKYLEGGIPVATLNLATKEIYKNKFGERVEQTEWHNVVLWRGLAQVVEGYVKKGTQLYIEGKIRTRSWEDQNGIKHNVTEIYADVMQILARKREIGAEPAATPTPVSTENTATLDAQQESQTTPPSSVASSNEEA